MRIIVDMDEVLAEFVEGTLDRWNMINKTRFHRDQINMWYMEETLGPNSYQVIEKWLNEPDFFENLEPIPGAIDGFRKLISRGHDVVIATSLDKNVENGYDSKRRWLKRHIPEFDLKNFICTSRKECIKGDILIDDAAHYLQAWRDAGNVNAIVMDAPWNKQMTLFPRAANWAQIDSIIRFHEAADEYHRRKNEFHDIQKQFEKKAG